MAAAGRSAFTRRAATSASSASTITWSVLPLTLNPTANFTGAPPRLRRCKSTPPTGRFCGGSRGRIPARPPSGGNQSRLYRRGCRAHTRNPASGPDLGGRAWEWARDVDGRPSRLDGRHKRRGMSQERAERRWPPAAGAELPRRWVRQAGLTAAVGLAYFFAAQLSLGLLTKPDGVAVFWPAAGVSAGVLIALGRSARVPVALGAIVATLVANLMGDRTVWGASAFAVCNAIEALLTAWLIERYVGPRFTLGRLRHVLALLAAAIVATAVSGIGGTTAYVLFHNSTAPIVTTWQHWFASDAVGIITVAPLLVGFAAGLRRPPPRAELIEGVGALGGACVMRCGSHSL